MVEAEIFTDVCLLFKKKGELIDDSEQAQRFFPNGMVNVIVESRPSCRCQ